MYKKIAALACSVAVAGMILGTPMASLAAPGRPSGGAPAPARGYQAPPRGDRHHHHDRGKDMAIAGGAGLLLGLVVGSVASGD